MFQFNPYLSFDGNCADAMRFYERVLGGTLEKLMTFAEMPDADQVPAEMRDRVMHARLVADNLVLMAGDAMPGQPYEGIKGFSLTISYASIEEAKPVFDALSEGGKVTMPFAKTFWAEGAGMVVDRFGAPWIVNGGLIDV